MSEADDFPSGEEILTKKQIADLALDIQKVVLLPGALPQVREGVKQWAVEWMERHIKWIESQEARDRHRDKAWADPRLRDKEAGPPKEGWVYEKYLTKPVHLSCYIPPTLLGTKNKDGKKKGTGKKNTWNIYISRGDLEKALGFPIDELSFHNELIEKTDKPPKKGWIFKRICVPGESFCCWTPPVLSWQYAPDDRFPLPIPTTSDKELNWPEKCAALAAVYDEGLVGPTKINPLEEEPGSSDIKPYWQLLVLVDKLTVEDESYLRAILREVEAKFNRKSTPKAKVQKTRTIPKSTEMKGRNAELVQLIEDQEQNDTGRGIKKMCGNVEVSSETFTNSAHFAEARAAWKRLKSSRNCRIDIGIQAKEGSRRAINQTIPCRSCKEKFVEFVCPVCEKNSDQCQECHMESFHSNNR